MTQLFVNSLNTDDYELKPLDGGSDYTSFQAVGVPIGGVVAHPRRAYAKKSLSEAQTYGGLAQVAFDPCYHLPCDGLLNIDSAMLYKIAKVTAEVLSTLADQRDVKSWISSIRTTDV